MNATITASHQRAGEYALELPVDLRDLFAGCALAGIIAADSDTTMRERTRLAYEYADALIQQRQESK